MGLSSSHARVPPLPPAGTEVAEKAVFSNFRYPDRPSHGIPKIPENAEQYPARCNRPLAAAVTWLRNLTLNVKETRQVIDLQSIFARLLDTLAGQLFQPCGAQTGASPLPAAEPDPSELLRWASEGTDPCDVFN